MNQFTRYAYSSFNAGAGSSSNPLANQIYQASNSNRTVFTGGDICAYINQIPVTNLESSSWTIQVDVVPNYVMGSRDAVAYTTGRRQISGTLVFSQYDRHALLEQVFQLSSLGFTTQGALWNSDNSTAAALQNSTITTTVNNTTNSQIGGLTLPGTFAGASQLTGSPAGAYTIVSGINPGTAQQQMAALNLQGLTSTQYDQFVQQAAQATAQVLGSTNLNYVDQIPPFDLTLIGVSRTGVAAKCSIFGIQCTTESGGFSSADISNAIGISYVALGVSPWRAITSLAGVAYVPPTS